VFLCNVLTWHVHDCRSRRWVKRYYGWSSCLALLQCDTSLVLSIRLLQNIWKCRFWHKYRNKLSSEIQVILGCQWVGKVRHIRPFLGTTVGASFVGRRKISSASTFGHKIYWFECFFVTLSLNVLVHLFLFSYHLLVLFTALQYLSGMQCFKMLPIFSVYNTRVYWIRLQWEYEQIPVKMKPMPTVGKLLNDCEQSYTYWKSHIIWKLQAQMLGRLAWWSRVEFANLFIVLKYKAMREQLGYWWLASTKESITAFINLCI